jgi:hypothetical protein
METQKKPISYYMRFLHKYVGFFILGFVLIYSSSGIILIYRDSDFLKIEKRIKVSVPLGTQLSELGNILKIRNLKILETKDNFVFFQDGSYNTSTGEAEYTVRELVYPFDKFTSLHKVPSGNPLHWITLIFGILLFFMALSSLWMINYSSKKYRNGILTVLAGVIFSAILLLVL